MKATDISFFLSEAGPFAAKSDFFEERPSQLRLTEKITETFNKDGIGVFEAGTGVGKSFAYLIPAMIWASENKERVIVSTGTINLQQQLIEKDIPQAEKIIGDKVKGIKSILLKGRQNYVCLRRFEEADAEQDWFSDDKEIFDKIADWVKVTDNGSRSDLSFLPPESVWGKINSESDACRGQRCPYHEKCFVMKVRKEAADASIIVVNHHLLFADIESRLNSLDYDDQSVLPAYRRIIFDEAHGIEDAATSFFSSYFNRFKFQKQLNYIYRSRHGSVAGYLYTISALSTSGDTTEIESEIYLMRQNLQALEIIALELLENEYSLRLFSGTAPKFSSVIDAITKFLTSSLRAIGLIYKMIDGLSDDAKEETVVWEAKTVLSRMEAFCNVLKNFTEWEEHPDEVFWIQKNRLAGAKGGSSGGSLSMSKGAGSTGLSKLRGGSTGSPSEGFETFFVTFNQTPLDIATVMNAGVYEPMKSIVCSSATLSIGGKFDVWKKRVGVNFIDKERLLEGEFKSPFPYNKNVFFAIPSDAPMPDSMDFYGYVENAVVKLIEAAAGRTLVLFTSYDSLSHCVQAARLALADSGITVLKQGDDDRFRLLNAFKEDESSVLFATDSFWEGVDVPGAALSQVVIVKLPFPVPSEPVFAARSEAVEKRGGNPFMELSVPDAVIKFRQGFGRLIRRTDDRGTVVVLDRRLVEKRYGAIFINSVPETKRLYAPLKEVLSQVTRFFK